MRAEKSTRRNIRAEAPSIRSSRLAGSFLSFVLFFAFACAGGDPAALAGNVLEGERRGRFAYRAEIRDLPRSAEEVVVWIPLPTSDAWQEVTDLDVAAPAPVEFVTDDAHGNRFARFRFAPPPSGRAEVELRFTVRRRALRVLGGAPIDTTPPAPEHLGPNRLIPIDDPIAAAIVAEARRVAPTDAPPLARAQRIYDHIVATVKYDKSGEGWGRGDAVYACNARRGNCTDFHSLFLGEARSVGVPARFVMGVPLSPPRAAGRASGALSGASGAAEEIPTYHCWAEFWTDETGWVPVDASEAAKNPTRREELFGGLDANRIRFTYGRDIPLPGAAADPVNFAIYPHVEVDGRLHTAVETKFFFEEATVSRSAG